MSIITGVFFDCLKYAVTKHLKGNKVDIAYYRPISMLVVFSKVTMYCRLNQYLQMNNILCRKYVVLGMTSQQIMLLSRLLQAYFKPGMTNF
jgi:hypothetical protein